VDATGAIVVAAARVVVVRTVEGGASDVVGISGSVVGGGGSAVVDTSGTVVAGAVVADVGGGTHAGVANVAGGVVSTLVVVEGGSDEVVDVDISVVDVLGASVVEVVVS
jgi:hypothetical protein